MKNTVLLLEDNPGVLEALTFGLEKGFTVFPARTLGSACEYLQNIQNLDAVVADYELSGTTGVNLLKLVTHVNPRAKRILISGVLPSSKVPYQYIDQFFPKPLDPESLRKNLRDVLGVAPLLDRSGGRRSTYGNLEGTKLRSILNMYMASGQSGLLMHSIAGQAMVEIYLDGVKQEYWFLGEPNLDLEVYLEHSQGMFRFIEIFD